ncbi:MAG: CpXC domain-containing protein [Anaerolineales bacterium]
MPTRKTQTICPNCRQPVIIEVEQLFDLNGDPQAKQRLLSGAANLLQCPHCGFQGPYSTPIVYHDPEKELLLTFVPPELGLPMDAQERVIGPMINQVVNRLPQERRKAYLLQPKTMFTSQTLLETILEADGITKEMLQAQQDRLNLLQRLANATSDDVLEEIARQEDKLVDRDFFELSNQMIANAATGGNEPLARRLAEVQEKLLLVTTFGQEARQQAQEVEAAVESLQALGDEITCEDLLDLAVKTTNETRLQALVSLARGGIDYQFFQILSERIGRARGKGKKRLIELREQLLTLTREYDQRIEAQMAQMREFVNALIEVDDIRAAVSQSAPAINELFVHVVQSELEIARKAGDLQRSGKLQQVLEIIEELSAPPPEVEIINQLIATPNPKTRQKMLESLSEEVLPVLVDTLTGLMTQMESSNNDPQVVERVQDVYRQVLRYSMRMRMKE